MGRKKLDVKGVRFSIFLHEDQLKWLDEHAKACGVSRSKFIEKAVFPLHLQTIEQKRRNDE